MPAEHRPISSSIGSTKQAANWPKGVPAPVKVGELGKKRLLISKSIKFLARASGSSPHCSSTSSNMIRHPPEHLFDGLDRLSIFTTPKVSLFKNFSELSERSIFGNPLGRAGSSSFHLQNSLFGFWDYFYS